MNKEEEKKTTTETENTSDAKGTAADQAQTTETVADDQNQTEDVAKERDALKETLAQKDDQILRLSAEIKNMQARHAKTKSQDAKYRSQSLATKLLPVIDSLEKALEIEADDEASENLKKGIEMVHTNFLKAFEAEGVEVMDPVGEEFDPNFHQSISSVEASDEHPENTVITVFQKGYLLNGRVLRPAMVIIAQ
ncbi:MAG: nucleotide exchange factor GrpE [Aerococcus sp.]|nr:nucleotide exchange factor GrpE [Aerococcus sp.]